MATVLIIDDSPTQVRYMRILLQGLRVLHRNSDSLSESLPLPEQTDLVLIALILTRNNGFECGARLRELGFFNIALYSDCPESTDADWAQAIGLQALLRLPAPMALLRQQVQSLLGVGAQGKDDGKRRAS